MMEVLVGARPLGEMLWTRETETALFDTPERRAGLEARLNQVTNAIANEAVKKYYRQDMEARLRALFQPQRAGAERGATNQRPIRIVAGARMLSDPAGAESSSASPCGKSCAPEPPHVGVLHRAWRAQRVPAA